MARKQSGGFNKFLNMIGLVDDVEPRDSYGDEYASGNYGRASTYVPPKQRGAQNRPAQQDRRSIPAQAGRSNYRGNSARTYGEERYDDYRSAPRRSGYSNSYDRAENYDAPPRSNAGAAARRSRFMEEEAPRRPETQAPVPVRNVRVSNRQRTVMCSLHTLEDCCEVIDHLINGNTIVLTMDELDGHLMQRAVDTLSGAVFALHADIRKASDRTYLIAPNGVEVNETYDVERRF